MASFREVFSTTGKVLIALIVIAVGVAVIWGVINALSSQSSLSRPPLMSLLKTYGLIAPLRGYRRASGIAR